MRLLVSGPIGSGKSTVVCRAVRRWAAGGAGAPAPGGDRWTRRASGSLPASRGEAPLGMTPLASPSRDELCGENVPWFGWCTFPVGTAMRRQGIALGNWQGEYRVFAHRQFSGENRFGYFGFQPEAFEQAVAAWVTPEQRRDLLLVDELGVMELRSPGFGECVARVLAEANRALVVIQTRARRAWLERLGPAAFDLAFDLAETDRNRLPPVIAAALGPPGAG